MCQYVVEPICRFCGDLVCKLEPKYRSYELKGLRKPMALIVMHSLLEQMDEEHGSWFFWKKAIKIEVS